MIRQLDVFSVLSYTKRGIHEEVKTVIYPYIIYPYIILFTPILFTHIIYPYIIYHQLLIETLCCGYSNE